MRLYQMLTNVQSLLLAQGVVLLQTTVHIKVPTMVTLDHADTKRAALLDYGMCSISMKKFLSRVIAITRYDISKVYVL
jgi:hypothetical protein